MNKIKPTIYSVLAISFLVLSLEMIISGFDVPGFNRNILVTISVVMAAIMFTASWVLWKKVLSNTNDKYREHRTTKGPLRVTKIILASYGVAFATSLTIILAGMWVFGFDVIDAFVKQYMGFTLVVVTIVSVPIVNKYLL